MASSTLLIQALQYLHMRRYLLYASELASPRHDGGLDDLTARNHSQSFHDTSFPFLFGVVKVLEA